MATIVGISGPVYGVRVDETSLVVHEQVTVTEPQFRAPFQSRINETTGMAIAALKQEVTVDGEANATSSGVWAFGFTTASSLANATNYHGGASAGSLLLTQATVRETFNGFLSWSGRFERFATLTV